ncbi:hypothetical protein NKR23_g10554 [Pleurostoma richardsiae]|uniref:Uncharacterized protein n=1 Tax=Pleurostoma richardsiae TaxID=41990 RepID=A0AA38R9U2_9PEZI|nr:hypothetical protein NKR23_g10554 [Pleurostoma richardsiae]
MECLVSWLCCCITPTNDLDLPEGRPTTPYPHGWTHYAPVSAYTNGQLPNQPIESRGADLGDHSQASRGRSQSPRPPSFDLAEFTAAEEGASEPLTADILPSVLRAVDKAFAHIPYAVCGTAALCVWGYEGKRPPTHISILCPAHAKDTFKSWAAANGGFTFSERPGYLGLRTPDGSVRQVKIKYLEHGFERQSIVSVPLPEDDPGSGRASLLKNTVPVVRVLSLPCLLDQVAESYLVDFTGPGAHRRRIELAKTVFWILECLKDGGEGMERLTPLNVPNVVKKSFWDLFAATYNKAPGEFRAAGLPVTPWGTPEVSACQATEDNQGYDTPGGPWNGPVYPKGAGTVFTVPASNAAAPSLGTDHRRDLTDRRAVRKPSVSQRREPQRRESIASPPMDRKCGPSARAGPSRPLETQRHPTSHEKSKNRLSLQPKAGEDKSRSGRTAERVQRSRRSDPGPRDGPQHKPEGAGGRHKED